MPDCLRRSSVRFAMVGVAVGLAVCALDARARAVGPESVIPPASAAGAWKQVGRTRTFNPSNLYDLIDGEAEAVRQYAFVAAAHAEYAPAKAARPAITVDVYDMSNPLNAFGLFGSDRLSGTPAGVGTESVRIAPTGLNFWKGRYVVRTAIVAPHPDSAMQTAQMALARAAAARILGASRVPAAVAALPPGRKPRSEKFVLNNVAGQSFLRNAIVGDYPGLGQGAQLFIAEYPTPSGAHAALTTYQTKERTSGSGLAPLSGVGSGGFRVVDRYQKNVVVAQKGRYLVGVVRAKDPNAALSLVKQAIGRVH